MAAISGLRLDLLPVTVEISTPGVASSDAMRVCGREITIIIIIIIIKIVHEVQKDKRRQKKGQINQHVHK